MIDVAAALPAGSLLRRRQARGDDLDTLRVLGHAEFAGGEVEPVVQALAFGPPLHCSIDSLDELYEVIEEGAWPPPPWESDPLDVALRRDPQAAEAAASVTRVMQQARAESDDSPPGPSVLAWREFQKQQNTTPASQEDQTHE